MIIDDNYYMNEAYKEALKAYKKNEVPVGCVIVYHDKIIARAHNLREKKKNSLYHAEVIAINKACKKLKMKFLEECVLYVTLEPCIMCAGASCQARIRKIVYGAQEPKFGCLKSLGNVFQTFKFNHQVEIVSGIMEEEISVMMKQFFKEIRSLKKYKNK